MLYKTRVDGKPRTTLTLGNKLQQRNSNPKSRNDAGGDVAGFWRAQCTRLKRLLFPQKGQTLNGIKSCPEQSSESEVKRDDEKWSSGVGEKNVVACPRPQMLLAESARTNSEATPLGETGMKSYAAF